VRGNAKGEVGGDVGAASTAGVEMTLLWCSASLLPNDAAWRCRLQHFEHAAD